MFKKSGAIVLTMLYIITVMGFAINLRYCGKVITAVNINAPVKSCNGNMVSSKMKCCTEKHIDIQIKDSHQGEFPSFLGKLFSLDIGNLPFADVAFSVPATETQTASGRAPPNPFFPKTPVFIKNCTYRI